MNILFIVTKSEEGGAQTHISQLAKALIARGDHVAVMSAPGGALQKESTMLGAVFFPCPHFKNSYNPFRLYASMSAVWDVVQRFKPDIVSCHSAIGGLVGRLAIRNRVPTIFTAHGWTFSPGASLLRRTLSFCVELVLARWSTKIVCVSDFDRMLALRYGIADERKLLTIHNGTEIPAVAPEPRANLRRIVFVGRLVAPKRPLEVLRALTLLSPDILDNLVITFIGGGAFEHALYTFAKTHRLEKYIRYSGAIPREAVITEVKNSDLLILTSSHEGLPRSIIEALSYGVPVLASGVGGVPELLQDGVGEILTPGNEANEIAQYLSRFYHDPALLAEMSMKAYQRAKESFSIERTIHETLNVYKTVLG